VTHRRPRPHDPSTGYFKQPRLSAAQVEALLYGAPLPDQRQAQPTAACIEARQLMEAAASQIGQHAGEGAHRHG
jgi:hypothetical protein